MTFDEFLKDNKKVKDKRNSKITNSIGLVQIYPAYKKALNNVSKEDYSKIIRMVNEEIINRIVDGDKINLPYRMGNLSIIKKENLVYFKDGKVHTNKPIDWQKTNLLWFNNEEAKKKKQLVRCDNQFTFQIKYYKGNAYFKNKNFFTFRAHRPVKIHLKELIKQDKLEALTLD